MKNRRLLSVITALVMSFAFLLYIPAGRLPSAIKANAAEGRLYNQYEEKWQNVIFTRYALSQNSMYISGCGIFSFCNAIYALNGNAIDAVNIAAWAVDNGSYQPGNGGMYYLSFYSKVESGYGELFNFRIDGQYYGRVTDARLINHLKNGGVAAIHVYGHLMAVTGYNETDNTYHVIESAVSGTRGLEPDGWVSAAKMSSGSTNVDWYALISDTTPPVTEKPDSPDLNLSKSLVSVNDEVEISWEAVSDSERYLISLYRNGEIYSEESTGDCNFKKQLPDGDYTAYICAENIIGVSDTDSVTFTVYGSVPDAPQLSVEKNLFPVDEPVSITWDSVKNTEYYSVSLYCDDELYNNTESYKSTEYTESLPEGSYTVCLSACNALGKSTESKVTFTVGDLIKGDINSDGSVEMSDIVLLQKHLLSSESLTAEQCRAADISNDGTVDIFDMVLLRQILIKK